MTSARQEGASTFVSRGTRSGAHKYLESRLKQNDACSPTSCWRGGLSLNPSRTWMVFWPFHFSGRIIEVDFTKHSLQFNEQCVQGTGSQWRIRKALGVGAKKKKIKRASAVCGGAQACRQSTGRAPLRTLHHILFHGRGKYKDKHNIDPLPPSSTLIQFQTLFKTQSSLTVVRAPAE